MVLYLRKARRQKRMTQKQLANLIQIAPQTVSALELGNRKGPVDTWDKLEEVLGVDQKILRQVEKDVS